MEVDRRAFIASLGGVAAVSLHGSRGQGRSARALHGRTAGRAWSPPSRPAEKFPTVAEIEAQIETRTYPARRRRPASPASAARTSRSSSRCRTNPTLKDFFEPALRAGQPRAAERDARDEDRHVRGDHPRLPAARLRAVAHQAGSRLVGRAAVRALHPGEERRSRSAITRRCASTPTTTRATSIRISITGSSATTTRRRRTSSDTYKMLKNHKWYMEPRLVTVNDLYAFDPNAEGVDRSVPRTSSAATSSSRRKASATTTARARTCGGRWRGRTTALGC